MIQLNCASDTACAHHGLTKTQCHYQRYYLRLLLSQIKYRIYSFPCALTLALDGAEWSASRPGHFTTTKRAASIQWIGG